MGEQQITVKQFFREVTTFRDLFCSQDFWKDDAKVERAPGAFFLCYSRCKTDNPDEQAQIQSVFFATIDEFNRRKTFAELGI